VDFKQKIVNPKKNIPMKCVPSRKIRKATAYLDPKEVEVLFNTRLIEFEARVGNKNRFLWARFDAIK
jgi:hypothetical protein